MAVALRFVGPVAATPGPVALRFGLTGEAPRVELTLAATLPAVTLPGLTFAGTVVRDLSLITDEGPAVALRHRERTPLGLRLALPSHDAERAPTGLGIAWQALMPLPRGLRLAWQALLPARAGLRLADAQALPLAFGFGALHAELLRQTRRLLARAAEALPLRHGVTAPHTETLYSRPPLALAWAAMIPLARGVRIRERVALPLATRLWLPHQSMILLPVWRSGTPPPPPPPPPDFFVRLRFCRLYDGSARLRFGACWQFLPEPPLGTVPIREVYIVLNAFSLVRADDGTPVEALEFTATLDADAWGWSWSAAVPASFLSAVRAPGVGEFVELIATLNGTPLRLVVERLGRDRQFGKSALRISGRGRAAWLAEPHSLIQTTLNTEGRTAQQLLNDALTLNGVALGWAVVWEVEDWSVPAGLLSHTGTYLSAATRLADSAGGYLQGHDTAETLTVKPYYPLAPWAWAAATPQIVLPEDACVTEGLEWLDKPRYTAVYVVGQAGGRRDRIVRAGTAGDVYAPTVVDPLATHVDMTRQRGLRVLGDTGRQLHLALALPIYPETGIIKPGALLQYTEQGVTHRGLTRGVTVRYQFPRARQTVRIETHELEPV